MPKSFLVKKRIERSKKPSSETGIVPNPGNGKIMLVEKVLDALVSVIMISLGDKCTTLKLQTFTIRKIFCRLFSHVEKHLNGVLVLKFFDFFMLILYHDHVFLWYATGFVREFNQVSAVRSVNKPQDTMPNQAKLLESRLTLVYEPKNLQVPHQFYNYPEHGNDRTQASPQNQGVEQFGFMKQALVDSTNVNEVKHAPGNHIPDGRIKQLSSKNHCQHCNKTYTSITNLLRHQQFHCSTQMKRPFHCKHCEKLYVSLGALKMHIRTHTLPCKCKICGKAFSRPWLLQGHIRTHTGEKPYKCQQCQRAFADRSNLRAHQQTHSDVKKYCCQRCSKSFSRMSLLHKHEDSCPGLLQHSKIF